MAAANIEGFNVLVGAIYAKLYQECPVAIELQPEDFEEQKAVNRPEQEVDDYRHRRDAVFFVSTVVALKRFLIADIRRPSACCNAFANGCPFLLSCIKGHNNSLDAHYTHAIR